MGYIHIYTGDGKGKTTCAMGLCLRALSSNFNVYVIQFMKPEPSGEIRALINSFEKLKVENFGAKGFLMADKSNKSSHIIEAQKALDKSNEILLQKNVDMLILDEAITAAHMKLIDEKHLISFMKNKPDNLEMILTGRGATENLISSADLVTEMQMIKHYYTEGVSAREGIEY